MKRLIAGRDGGPWLVPAAEAATRSREGQAYVFDVKLLKLRMRYVSLALIARQAGRQFRAVQRLMDDLDIQRAFDPTWLGAHLYRRADVFAFLAGQDGLCGSESDRPSCPANISSLAQETHEKTRTEGFGESYDVILWI